MRVSTIFHHFKEVVRCGVGMGSFRIDASIKWGKNGECGCGCISMEIFVLEGGLSVRVSLYGSSVVTKLFSCWYQPDYSEGHRETKFLHPVFSQSWTYPLKYGLKKSELILRLKTTARSPPPTPHNKDQDGGPKYIENNSPFLSVSFFIIYFQ